MIRWKSWVLWFRQIFEKCNDIIQDVWKWRLELERHGEVRPISTAPGLGETDFGASGLDVENWWLLSQFSETTMKEA